MLGTQFDFESLVRTCCEVFFKSEAKKADRIRRPYTAVKFHFNKSLTLFGVFSNVGCKQYLSQT